MDSHVYVVIEKTIDEYENQTNILGVFKTKKSAIKEAKKHFKQWDKDDFESYNELKDAGNEFEIEAIFPEGENTIVTVEKMKLKN